MLPRGFHHQKRPFQPPVRNISMQQKSNTGKRSLERAGLFTDRSQDEVKRRMFFCIPKKSEFTTFSFLARTSTDLAYDNLMAELAAKTQGHSPVAAPANQAEEIDP
jgi:hypothetical protein